MDDLGATLEVLPQRIGNEELLIAHTPEHTPSGVDSVTEFIIINQVEV